MIMKKVNLFLCGIAAVVVGAVATVNVSLNLQNSYSSNISLANVEALSIEQPDVNNCIYSPYNACEALHPTDPALDKIRLHALWP
jgi:hypothetical protein